MNIVLLGPAGSGRGTQAALLEKKYNIPKIATGDILRKEMWHESDLGKKIRGPLSQGQLLPDALINHLVNHELQNADVKRGYVLDGYPRNIPQAEELDATLATLNAKLEAVLLLEVDASVLSDRLTWRRVCPHGHGEWNIRLRPSSLGAQCEECKATLIQREDDTPTGIRNRLLSYSKSIETLKSYYSSRDIVRSVNAEGTPDETTARLEQTVKALGISTDR